MAEDKPAIDKELIRELAQLLDETGLTEIEIEREGLRVRVGRAGSAAPAVFRLHLPASALFRDLQTSDIAMFHQRCAACAAAR